MIMNKKEYIQPSMHVVAIKAMGMIASSIVGRSISNTEATGDALGRQDNSWNIWGSDDDIDD